MFSVRDDFKFIYNCIYKSAHIVYTILFMRRRMIVKERVLRLRGKEKMKGFTFKIKIGLFTVFLHRDERLFLFLSMTSPSLAGYDL